MLTSNRAALLALSLLLVACSDGSSNGPSGTTSSGQGGSAGSTSSGGSGGNGGNGGSGGADSCGDGVCEMPERMGQGACAEDCGSVAEKVYVLFTINVHDWTNRKSAQSFTTPSDTAATMHAVIDLHEARQIPVDVYLTDPMVSLYEKEAPSLVERFKTSPVVAVSYHVRPSSPYYSNFDQHDSWGLPQGAGTTQEWYDALLPYEQHRLVVETGKPDTNKPGGYAQLKDFIGYPPYAVGMVSGGAPKAKALAKIYREMGAAFGVVHGVDSSLGDQVNGINIRPEHVEIKLYEYKSGSKTAREILEAQRLSDDRYARAVKALGEPAVVELVSLIGFYIMVAVLLVSYEVEIPDGGTPPLND